MVKRTQIIHLLLPTNCLSVVDHFVGLVLHGLTYLTRIFDGNIFTNSKTPTAKFNVPNIFRFWYTLSLEIVAKFHLIFQLIFKLNSIHYWNHQKTTGLTPRVLKGYSINCIASVYCIVQYQYIFEKIELTPASF